MNNEMINIKEDYSLCYYSVRCKVASFATEGMLRHQWLEYNDAVNDAIKLLKELYDRNINDKCELYIYEVHANHVPNKIDDTYKDYRKETILSCMQINYIK